MKPDAHWRQLDAYCELLRQLGAHRISHYGRPLLSHLKGVYALLVEWNNPQETCVAGLFHSIYGTERLDAGQRSPGRAELRAVIGERSEELVFLFGVADRTRLLANNIRPPYQVARRDRRENISVTPDTLAALVEIGAANLVEFMPYLPVAAFRTVREEVGLLQGMQEYLSGPAGRALFLGLNAFQERQRAAMHPPP